MSQKVVILKNLVKKIQKSKIIMIINPKKVNQIAHQIVNQKVVILKTSREFVI